MPELCDIAREVLDEIRESFPDLEMRYSESHIGEPELEIPSQPGLLFDVALYLYGDVLNMCAGSFWGEWFPCRDSEVVSRYIDAVSGVIAGEYRIVEYTRNGRTLKALLQRPKGDGWENISRHYHGFYLPWMRKEKLILQNVAA